MKKPVFFLLTMIICSYISFACANISDYKVMTWNLQGSSASTESKWNVNVRQLLSGTAGVDILMVQEAGAVPPQRFLPDDIFSLLEWVFPLMNTPGISEPPAVRI